MREGAADAYNDRVTPCTAILLAGGRSIRMGEDKASLPFGAGTLLSHTLGIVRGAVSGVVIAARRGQVVPDDVRVVFDEAPGSGPLAALAAAIVVVDTPVTFVVACDMPLLKPALIAAVVDALGDADAAVPSIDGRWMVTCTALRTAAAAPAARALVASGERSLHALVRSLHPRVLTETDLRGVDADLSSFVSCNTPAEYAQALARARSRHAGGGA